MGQIIVLMLVAGGLFAQGPLVDPGIPDNEVLRYQTTDGEKSYVTEWRASRSTRDNKGVLEFSSQAPEKAELVVLGVPTLDPLVSRTTQKVAGAGYTASSALDVPPVLREGELLVLRTSDLLWQLRGYPFGRPRTLKVFLVGNPPDNGFSLEVQYRGQEEVTLGARKVSAHKLELVSQLSGALALFSGLIPKVYLWYDKSAPHVLLRYQGSGGFGANRPLVLELR